MSWKCDVEDAKQVLMSLDGIGFLDDMESTLQAWREMFNITRVDATMMPHNHVTKHNGTVEVMMDPVLRESIISHNAVDLALDAWAREYISQSQTG